MSAICSIISGTFPAPRRSMVAVRVMPAKISPAVALVTTSNASGRTMPFDMRP
jgi:hypothetical protein